jgi:tetratricopeptide (TPR) repeat protein
VNTFDFDKLLLQARHSVQVKNFPDALKLYGQLVKDYPQNNLWEEYGRTAASAGEYDLAEQIWEKMRAAIPNTADFLTRLAGEYGKIWLFSKARALSFEAVKLEPKNLGAELSLASFLSRTNSVEEARAAVNRCLELDPHSEAARYLSAHLLRREDKLTDAEQRFRDLLSANLRDPQVRYFSHLELARILDSTRRFDEAMTALVEAKRLAAQSINSEQAVKVFDERRERVVRRARALPKDILTVWSRQFPPEARKLQVSLAFLGGHARSGTTLLERILDAHPSVAACDEALAIQTIAPLIDVTTPELPVDGLNFLRQRYMNNLTKVLDSPPAGKILVDKNPPITAYLPAFLRAFPELRVLIALRDPRDVLVSCYFQTLVQVSHFSFERLAQHYSCIMDVWLAVRQWDGLAWMETRYEDIVEDLHKEGARVTKFLGLDWHENQARFHEKNREKPVMSTNYNDVTRPVYKRSIGRWQAYEKYLAPALPILEPYCKEFGYT